MPTIMREGPYRFFFFSGDQGEPPHVHVERDDRIAKFWLDPVRLQSSGRMRRSEIPRIEELIEDNRTMLVEAWDEHFSG